MNGPRDKRLSLMPESGGFGNDAVSLDCSIDMSIGDGSSEKEFSLPHVVKTRIEADIKQANAFAITTALFAAVLMTLAQLIADKDKDTPAWRILRFFTYASVIVNLSGTTLALALVKMSSELHYTAYRWTLLHPHSLPAQVAKQGIPRAIMLDRYRLLEEFGMPQGYKILDIGASFWVISGNAFTIASVLMWVWMSMDVVIASVTTVTMIIPICGVIYAVVLTKHR